MLRKYGHLLELVIIRRELLYPPVFVPSHMYICVCCCDSGEECGWILSEVLAASHRWPR